MPRSFHQDTQRQLIAASSGPGRQTLRTPFVTLRVNEFEIPLLDASRTANNGSTDKQPQNRQSPNFLLLKNFSYLKDARGGSTNQISLTVIDPQWNYLDQFVTEIENNNRRFSVSYGWRGIDDADGLPQSVVEFIVFEIDVQLIPFQGAQVTLVGTDAGIRLSFEPRNLSFDSTRTISSVISEVMRLSTGLQVEVAPIPIEIGNEHNRMENRTAAQYVRHLMRIAKSQRGDSSFVFRIVPSDDKSEAKIQLVSEQDSLTRSPSRRYIYGREFDGQMMSFQPRMMGTGLISQGGGRASGFVVDPLRKTVLRLTSTQRDDPGHNPRKALRNPDTDHLVFELPFSKEKGEALVRAERERRDRYAYEATASVYGDTGIEPLDNIAITVLKGDTGQRGQQIDENSIHQFGSGIFRVESVTHTITAGSFTTDLELYRNSGLVGPSPNELLVSLQELAKQLTDFLDIGVKLDVQPLQEAGSQFLQTLGF